MDRGERTRRILELKAEGLSHRKISEALDIDRTYVWRVCTGKEKRHPRARLEAAPSGLTAEQIADRMRSVEAGAITEALTCVKLLSLGFDVWRPFIDRHRCDVGVYVNGHLVRLQVKTASYDATAKRFRTSLDTKKNGMHLSYADGEFEFFIVKCSGIDEYYIIPVSVGNALRYINLYPHRDKLTSAGEDLESYHNNFALLRNAGVG